MNNFINTQITLNGVSYERYTADRKRGGANWTFYCRCPEGFVYNPTWPEEIQTDGAFSAKDFWVRLEGDDNCVDFLTPLDASELTSLDTLYDNHVAPVVI